MFEADSRYAPIEQVTVTMADGRVVAYKRRRFLPQGTTLPLLAELQVPADDRIDLLTGRTLGNPEHFWRICDANDVMDPAEVTDTPGRTIRIPVPQP
jgi:hypothetical protein